MFCRVSIPVIIVFFAVSILVITMCFTGCISGHCVLQGVYTSDYGVFLVQFLYIYISVITMSFFLVVSVIIVFCKVFISVVTLFFAGCLYQ